MSHTKGKWIIEEFTRSGRAIISCEEKAIVDAWAFAVGHKEALANAHLICAAPALLEALERIVIIHGNAIGEETLLHAKRAIASAKGSGE